MDCWNGAPNSSNSILLHDVCVVQCCSPCRFAKNGVWQQKIILCSVWKMPSLRRFEVPVYVGYFLLLMRALRFGACNATMQLIHMRWFCMYCVCKSHWARERKIPHCCGCRTRVFSIVNRPICRKMPSHSTRYSSHRFFVHFMHAFFIAEINLNSLLLPLFESCFQRVRFRCRHSDGKSIPFHHVAHQPHDAFILNYLLIRKCAVNLAKRAPNSEHKMINTRGD